MATAGEPSRWIDYRTGIGLSLILAGGVLLPSGIAKFLATAVGIILACGPAAISRAQTRFILGAVFALSYIVLPYWRTLESPLHQQVALGAFCLVGLAWLWISGDALKWGGGEASRGRDFGLAAVVGVLFVLSLPGLHAQFALGGDEVHHIIVTNVLRMNAADPWTIIATLVMLPCLWAAWWLSGRESPMARWGALGLGVAGIAPLLLLPLVPGLTHEQMVKGEPTTTVSYLLLRYPCFTYWPRALFMTYGRRSALDLSEYRVFPAASFLALGAAFYLLLDSRIVAWLRALFALALATIPSMMGYVAKDYLEMPLLVLELVVCVRLDAMLRMSFSELRRDIGWFCLLLAGFIKEVTFPLSAIFAVLYGLVQLREILSAGFGRRDWAAAGRRIGGVVAAGVCANIPIGVYLFMRNQNNPRVYKPDYSVFWNSPGIYRTVLHAAWEQYYIIGLLALVAAVWLIARRQFLFVVSNLLIVVSFFVFFTADSPAYVGLARWGLLMYIPLAALLIRALTDINWNGMTGGIRGMAGAVGAALIAINLVQSPVALDGTLPDHWGMYNLNDAEVYYPFDKLFPWLTANLPNEAQIPIVGQPSNRQCSQDQYSYTWRGRLPAFKSPNEKDPVFPTQVQQAVDAARSSGLKHVVWSLPTTKFDPADVGKISGASYIAQFSNARHTMVVLGIN